MVINIQSSLFCGTYITDIYPYDNYHAYFDGGCALGLVLAIDPAQNMSFTKKIGDAISFSYGDYSIDGVVNNIENLGVTSDKITFGQNGGYQYTDYDYSGYKFIRVRIENTIAASATPDPTLGKVISRSNINLFGGYGFIQINSPDGNNYTGPYNLTRDANNYLNNTNITKRSIRNNSTYYDFTCTKFSSFSPLQPKGLSVSGSSSGGSSATPIATTPPTTTPVPGTPSAGITAPPSSPTVTNPPEPPPSIKAYNVQIANCGAAYIKGAIITCQKYVAGQTSIPTKATIHLVEDANAGSFKYPGDSAAISFYIDGIAFNGKATGYRRYNPTTEPIAIYELTAGALDDTSISDKLLGDTVGAENVNVYINENGTQDAILNPNGINFGTTKFEYITTGFLNSPPSNYNTTVSWNSFAQNASAISISNLIYKSHTYAGPNVELLQFDKTVATPVINVYAKTTSSTAPASIPSPTAGGSSSTTTTGTGSTATTTTTSMNAFGAGTVVTVAPNTQSLPAGTTTTIEVINGLTITTTVTVDAATNKVTTTKNTSFTPSLNTTNPQLANKRRALMGIPNDFQGAIDPTVAFPSTQVAGKFGESQSGVFFQANVSPTSFDLDPYFFFTENTVFQTGVNKQLKPLYGSGVAYKNDFQVVVKDGYSDGADINIRKVPYNNNVRTMGFRGPVVLSGWGYDVRGLPVPNGSNETVQTGVYTNPNTGKETALYGLDPSGQYKFNPKTPVRRNLWKSGPVDLRWHEDRKVWVGGQEILEGYLLDNLASPTSLSGVGSSKTARMSVLRVAGPSGLTGQDLMSVPPSALYNNKGEQTGVAPAKYTHEFITITNRDRSLSANAGTYVMAIDINYEWRPIYVGC